MEDRKEVIARLIARKMIGEELTSEEERVVNEWVAMNPANQEVMETSRCLEMVREMMSLEQKNYGERMASGFMARKMQQTRRRSHLRLYRYVGSLVAVICVGILVAYCWIYMEKIERRDGGLIELNGDVAGGMEAVLTLAGGEVIHLMDTINKEKLEERLQRNNEEWKGHYHLLSIPMGKEYFYELPDGTKVWLNSETELRFPVSFTENKRQVFLKGEAFFNVAKNVGKPFIVSLPEGDIEVFGTRFNIMNYENNDLAVVLVAGSIGFTSKEGVSVDLLPENKMVYDRKTSMITIEKVDTMFYTSWINKLFIFHDQCLSEIMETLARWYNLNIIFESEDIKKIRLSGRLNRIQDVRILLRTYEKTAGVIFRIEGRNVYVLRRE